MSFKEGAVRTDPITFIKSLGINTDTKTFEWKYESAENITITNSLTMSEFKPYKDTDYDVVNEMLNELKSKEPTVKSKLLEALNANFTKILAKFVHENNDVKIKIFRHGKSLKKYTMIIMILTVPFQLLLTILCYLSLLTKG